MSVQEESFLYVGRFTLMLVPRTHFDISWWVTERVFVNYRFDPVMSGVMDTLEAGSNLCFTSDCQVYLMWKWINNPVLLSERLRRYERVCAVVKSGQLQVGPSLILPDSFLTPGEAHVRNKLIGRKLAVDLGAPKRQADDESDIFGFAAQIPQIGADFSDFHIHSRGLSSEQLQHIVSRWVAPNGSYMVNILQPGGYGNAYAFGRKTRGISMQTVAEFMQNYSAQYEKNGVMLGLFCGGGDHTALGGRIIEDLEAAAAEFPDIDFIVGTDNDYVAALNVDPAALPVIRGELYASGGQDLLRNVDSSRIYLKQRMYRVFNTVIHAETMVSLLAMRTHVPAVNLLATLERCWIDYLVFQSHDAITACHVDEVTQYILSTYDGVEQELNMVLQKAMADLSGQKFQMAHSNLYGLIPASRFGLWNPLPYERSEVAIVDLPHELEGTARLTALVNGQSSEIQRLDATRAALPVAMGSFGSTSVDITAEAKPVSKIIRNLKTIRNEYLSVTVGPNGTYDVIDKLSGRKFCGLGRLTSEGDRGDEYNRYLLGDRVDSTAVQAQSRLTVSGPLVQEIEIKFDFLVPERLNAERDAREGRVTIPVVTTLCLRRGSRHLEITTRINNRASDQLLRVEFPVGEMLAESRALSVFIVQPHPVPPPTDPLWLENTTDHEAPFTTFSNQGMVIAGPIVSFNYGLTEYEVYDTPSGKSVYAHTLQRGVGYLSRDDNASRRIWPGSGMSGAGPQLEVPAAQCHGEQSFAYTLGFVGQCSDIELAQQAQKWQHGFVLAPFELNTNGIANFRLEKSVFSALKPADPGVILRSWAGPEPTWMRLEGEFTEHERVTMAEEPSPARGLHVAHHEIANVRLT